jgi:hypothetical protein
MHGYVVVVHILGQSTINEPGCEISREINVGTSDIAIKHFPTIACHLAPANVQEVNCSHHLDHEGQSNMCRQAGSVRVSNNEVSEGVISGMSGGI